MIVDHGNRNRPRKGELIWVSVFTRPGGTQDRLPPARKGGNSPWRGKNL